MNLTNLNERLTLLGTDELIIQGVGETTQKVRASVLAQQLISILCGDSAGSHNAIYRGKNLGDTLTAAQSAAIRAGTFDDLYIGDYWAINGINWRIAHFDYWYRCGDQDCTTHHAVIVPDTHLYTAQMHNTESGAYEAGSEANTTAGGYVGSDMRTTNLAQAKEMFTAAFGADHILTHREHLTNAATNGRPSGGTWYDSDVELMNENMVYGSHIFAPASDGSNVPNNYTISRGQLMLFQYQPNFIHANQAYWYWLRDVVSAACFACVNHYGHADYGNASYVVGVRPACPIY